MAKESDFRILYGIRIRTVPESRPKVSSNNEIQKWEKIVTAVEYARDCVGPGERAYYAQMAECLAYAMSRSAEARKALGITADNKQSELTFE